jgi:hypothetical protein
MKFWIVTINSSYGKYLISAHFYSTINKHNMCASNMSFRLLTAWRFNGWKVTERLSTLVELLEWLTVWLWQYESRIWRNKLISSENKDTRSRFTYIKYEVQFGIWNHRNISINRYKLATSCFAHFAPFVVSRCKKHEVQIIGCISWLFINKW